MPGLSPCRTDPSRLLLLRAVKTSKRRGSPDAGATATSGASSESSVGVMLNPFTLHRRQRRRIWKFFPWWVFVDGGAGSA